MFRKKCHNVCCCKTPIYARICTPKRGIANGKYWKSSTYQHKFMQSHLSCFTKQNTITNKPTKCSFDQAALLNVHETLCRNKPFRRNAVPKLGHQNCSVHFGQLKDDIVLLVLSHLPTDELCRVSRVCLRWHFIIWNLAVWDSICINQPSLDVDLGLSHVINRLISRTHTSTNFLQRVNLKGSKQLSDSGLIFLANHCPHLMRLDVQGCVRLSDEGVFQVTKRCTKLEHFDLTGNVIHY